MNAPINSSIDRDDANSARTLIEEAVAEALPGLVHEAVGKEEERRFRQLKWIAVFLGLIGLGTFGTLATFAIEKAVDAKAGNIRETLELTRINSLALKLTLGKGFSPGERDESMALLMRISKSPSLKAAPDVKNALSDVLRSFVGAGLVAEVDQLYEAFKDEVLVSGLSCEIVLHHFGQALVARVSIPTSDDHTLRRFEQLERVSPGHELLELAYAYRVLFESQNGAKDERIRALALAPLDLDAKDAVRFWREILTRTRATNWQTAEDPSGSQIQRVARHFLKSRSKLLAEVYAVTPDLFEEIARDGVDADDARSTASLLISKARSARSRTKS